MRHDLKHVTFLIPYKYDHPDRFENMELCRMYLDKHFNTNIIIEVANGLFHRTKMINSMARKAITPIIINYDCDVFIHPLQIVEAVKRIEQGEDIVFPYDGRFARVPRSYYPELKRTLSVDIFEGIEFTGMGAMSKPKVGGCIVHNKASFFDAGGENEKFISWGHEDRERYDRFTKLGYIIDRVPGVLYHLDHHIGSDSSADNPHYTANLLEYKYVTSLCKEQLKEYVCQNLKQHY